MLELSIVVLVLKYLFIILTLSSTGNSRIINKYLSTRTTIDNSEIYYIEAIKNK